MTARTHRKRPYTPPFRRIIRDGCRDARAAYDRTTLRLLARGGLAVLLTVVCVTSAACVWKGTRAQATAMRDCQSAQTAASAAYRRASDEYARMVQAVRRMDDTAWNLDKATTLMKSRPDMPRMLDCAADPDKAGTRAERDTARLDRLWRRYRQARL